MDRKKTIKITSSAICLALAIVFPFITGQIQQIGNMFCPMHIPVLLCGFICGWPWGLAVGFIAPLLRSAIFGMPVMFPQAVAMAFELATYGLLAGICYKIFPKKIYYYYISLLISMIGGRIVWGIAEFIFVKIQGAEFTVSAFVAGALTYAIPGIIIQILLVPVLVFAFENAKLIANE